MYLQLSMLRTYNEKRLLYRALQIGMCGYALTEAKAQSHDTYNFYLNIVASAFKSSLNFHLNQTYV